MALSGPLHWLPVSLLSIAVLFSVISVALNKWEHYNTSSRRAYGGLWKGCVSRDEVECEDVDDRDVYNVVRALMFVGMFGLLVANVAAGIANCVPNQAKTLGILTLIAAFAGGLMLMCAFSVYAEDIKRYDTSYGSCFVLTVVSWILAWISAGLGAYNLQSMTSQPSNEDKEVLAVKNSEEITVSIEQSGSDAKTQ